MKIDYDEGVDVETMSLEEFKLRNPSMPVDITGVNTVTVYSIKPEAETNYCPKHQGNVVVDDRVLRYTEECNCV